MEIDYSKDWGEEDSDELIAKAEEWWKFTRNSVPHQYARIVVEELLQALVSSRREINYPGGI